MLVSSQIPQADRLERVGEFVMLTVLGALEIRDALFGERDRGYYAHAAHVLGLLDDDDPTVRGRSLVARGPQALAVLSEAFRASPVGRAWSQWANVPLEDVPPMSAAEFLAASSDLAESTRERRARTLASWLALALEHPCVAEPLPADPSWETLQKLFPVELRGRNIAAADPPARILTYCKREGITTIDGVLQISEADLLATRSLGPGSVHHLRRALRRFVDSARPVLDEQVPAAEVSPAVDAMEALVRAIEGRHELAQEVLRRRLGLGVPACTLEEIAQDLDLSRERIRQIESEAFDRILADGRLHTALEQAFGELCTQDPYVVLEEAQHDWLDPLLATPMMLRKLVKHLLGERWSCESWGDGLLLRAVQSSAPQPVYEAANTWVAEQPLPLPLAALDLHLATLSGRSASLRALVRDRLLDRWAVAEDADEPSIVGRGNSRRARVLQRLLSTTAPVSVQSLVKEFGRSSLPEGAVYVRRGWVTLVEHLPDFDQWAKRLGPPLQAYVEDEGPEREWMAKPLLEYARGIAKLPEWITHMLLSEMLVRSGAFISLGRQRLALAGFADEERTHLLPKLQSLLEEAGAPVPEDTLFERMREHVEILEGTFALLRVTPPLFKLGDGCIGLIPRDIPGGAEAIERATTHVLAVLQAPDAPPTLRFVEALAAVQDLGAPFDAWQRGHLRGAMRTTPRVHGTRGGFRLPNAPDDDARPDEVSAEHDTPPQLDAPEQEGPPAGEPKPEPERVAKPAPQASPLPSRDISFPTARDLGLPRRARDLYSRLADETPGDIEALAQRVQAHAITFEQESAHSEFLPLDEAKAIAAGFPTLRAASDGSPAHTRMVWIVGRYFEISDDGTPDFSIGGLDDDVAVFNAAARFLGAPSAQIEQIV